MDEKEYLIIEMEGLLEGLQRYACTAKVYLALGNLRQLAAKTNDMKLLLSRIESKIEECNANDIQDDDGELY